MMKYNMLPFHHYAMHCYTAALTAPLHLTRTQDYHTVRHTTRVLFLARTHHHTSGVLIVERLQVWTVMMVLFAPLPPSVLHTRTHTPHLPTDKHACRNLPLPVALTARCGV